MKCYAVIDTNVLVSALISSHDDAATVRVITKVLTGEVIPLYSTEIIREYNEVLRRPKFGFDESLIKVLLDAFEKFGVLIYPSDSEEILPDMKDLPFYEVVLECKDDSVYLVTGNIKHFPLKPFIVTPAQFLELLENNYKRNRRFSNLKVSGFYLCLNYCSELFEPMSFYIPVNGDNIAKYHCLGEIFGVGKRIL